MHSKRPSKPHPLRIAPAARASNARRWSVAPGRRAWSGAKAHQRLTEPVFVYLNPEAIKTFYAGWATRRWQRFRPSAVDGMTFRLSPREGLAQAFER